MGIDDVPLLERSESYSARNLCTHIGINTTGRALLFPIRRPLPEKQPLSRKPTGLFFDSAAEAQYANADIIDHWNPPKHDATIPTTHVEKLTLIKDLIAAITTLPTA
ncbi:hypothetical protein N0V91_009683 [Didymella pomorum]|uniref:Uncharacterized protein n=1 Tax=Didymella pomorum TaxID=749634 RepID=A0A9W8Z4Y4_9PLEO|nr:hypothetical protein N0V91_009683 [Didymella pomorum]